eukprot:2554433-Pleurochrysis_carterae.AAC.1
MKAAAARRFQTAHLAQRPSPPAKQRRRRDGGRVRAATHDVSGSSASVLPADADAGVLVLVRDPAKRGSMVADDISHSEESDAVKRASGGGRPRVQCRLAECIAKSASLTTELAAARAM